MALVSVAASFWGKANCEYPGFLVVGRGWAIRDRKSFETNTRESLTIDKLSSIGFI